MSLDNLSDTIDSATTDLSNSISSGVSSIVSGAASALSAVGNAVSGLFSSLGSAFKPIPNIQLPLPNPLFDYASYDYVLGLACLTDEQLNNPDKGYMSGAIPYQIIAKDANADPKNRVTTPYGQFDYFIDKLEIDSTIGLEKGNNTNVHTLNFQVTEPYSMGTFMMALQQAAWNTNPDDPPNYTQAPFLLTIEFRGSKENGVMANIPNASRRIPFRFRNVTMTVTEAGAVYKCTGFPWNSQAQSSHVSAIKSDHSVNGTTVQEVLQTGEKSLQAALNKRLQQLQTDKIVKKPDQIVILFPTDVSSAGVNKTGGDTEDSTGATTQTDASSVDAVAKKLGLTQSSVPGNGTLVQDPANVNGIGKAKMGFSDTRKGDAPIGKDNKTYDDKGNNIRSNNTVDPKVGDLRFSQDTDITTAIDTVLLNSDYATTQLDETNIDDKGQRKWWRIDTQVYNITDNDSNAGSTNDKPKIIVYRIVPYGVHTSKTVTPGGKAPGLENLKKECVKQYNYIYTGKNIDVMSFNIEVKTGFATYMGASATKRTIDNQVQESASGADSAADKNNTAPMPDGKKTEKKLGIQPVKVNYSATSTGSDNRGGGGIGNEKTRIAQQFHDAITSAASMVQLDMKIIGDPYWIAHSGMGNYTSVPSQYQNLNNDGTVNYQNGEVHVSVDFRSPVDINQSTGLYDFGKSAGNSVPLLQWSGIYQVIKVISNFDGGSFTQKLSGPRINGQENTGAGASSDVLNVSNEKKDPDPVTEPNSNG